MADLDAFDLRILDLAQEDAELPARWGCRPPVQRRVLRLKRDGIIERAVALVEPRSLRRAVTVLVEVEIDNERAMRWKASSARLSRRRRCSSAGMLWATPAGMRSDPCGMLSGE
jgi:DNA-binding Lrp family transcriptional regulator